MSAILTYQKAFQDLQKSLGTTLVTRFAPSPTGYLHLGHVASALIVWGLAKAVDGKVILRMEDHDRGRFRPEYENAAIDDLSWLGFTADNLREAGKLPKDFVQSNRTDRYQELVTSAFESAGLYYCNCSRRQIKARTASMTKAELFYDGHCRMGSEQKADSGLRVPVSAEPIRFNDLILGPQEQSPEQQCGDFLIKDRHGNWTYQYAVVVDDCDQGINCIIRGVDILPSTGRQIFLRQQFFPDHDEEPAYLHHPLLKDNTGEKLAKRFLSDRARHLHPRPEQVLAAAARGLGIDVGDSLSLGQWINLIKNKGETD